MLALVFVLAGSPAVQAHDDPPGHYLETDLLFPAFATRPSAELELELTAMLRLSAAGGYPVKVALVGSEDDLIDPEMLRLPQRYAQQIATQLTESRVLEAPVVVVTPFGIGIAGIQRRDGRLLAVDTAGARRLVGTIRVPEGAQGDDLARTAMAEVRQIATAAGAPLPEVIPVPPAYVLPSRAPRAATAPAATPDDAGSAVLPAVIFIALFFAAWLAYEAWGVLAERRKTAPP